MYIRTKFHYHVQFLISTAFRFPVHCYAAGSRGHTSIAGRLVRQQALYQNQPEDQPFRHDIGTHATSYWFVPVFFSPFVTFSSETMKDPTTRYWTVEHISMMIFAIALITVGHSRSKTDGNPVAKHRSIAIYYSLALLVIVLAIIQSMRPFFGVSA